MSRNALPLRPGLTARPLCFALLVTLLGALAIAPCALAAGARPWLAPGQQSNDTAPSQQTDTTAPEQQAGDTAPEQQTGAAPAAIPDDAAAQAQYEVIRRFFRGQLTLDEDFPLVFSRRVKDGETLAFLAMREMQRSRGLLERFRAAEVNLEGLVFTRVTADPDLARIRVTGRYSLSVPPVEQTVEEDALFVLLPELGEWRIWERREGWRP
ncbi:MAG: hypothetical protein C0405_02645 [Desulfovibrio sp.]|nr:hypothetical protein [Desulfovibrio sp.]